MPMHASWADANRAVALLRAVLDLDTNDDVRIESAPGPNRNAVFRIVTPRPVFLKLYRPGSPADAGSAEATASSALGHVLPVPDVIAHGVREGDNIPYLITEARPGDTLEAALRKAAPGTIRPVLSQLLGGLRRVARSAEVRSALSALSSELIGAHARDFCPLAWLRQHAPATAALFDGFGSITHRPVLGSLSSNNILADQSSGTLSLSAYIDFEGARIGPTGFDHAMFWYDLLLQGRADLADEWLRNVLRSAEAELVSGMLVNAAWLSTMRTCLRHPEQQLASNLAPIVLDALEDAVVQARFAARPPADLG